MFPHIFVQIGKPPSSDLPYSIILPSDSTIVKLPVYPSTMDSKINQSLNITVRGSGRCRALGARYLSLVSDQIRAYNLSRTNLVRFHQLVL